MSSHVGIRAPGHISRTFGHPGGGLGPGIVTSVEVLGDINIAITSPSAMSVPMQTNGTAIRIATSGSAAYTGLDLTKITLTVADRGWDASGAQVTQTRTVGVSGHLIGPYNAATAYQPNPGEFYLKLANRLYNQDLTWFSTVTAVNFAAGWLTGQPAGVVSTVARSDSKPYDPISIQAHCPFWQRVAAGGKLNIEFACVSRWPKNASMVACVEAWALDGASATGAVARQSVCARSANTPNDSTLQGKPAATYALQVDPAGLAAGRCAVRWRVKPWIGPSIDGAAYGAAIYSAGNYKIPFEFPFGYDTDGSHAPLYGCLIYDPAATPTGFVRTITSNLNTSTVDVSGLCLTQAGAEASGVYYPDLGTLFAAVQRLNGSASNLTILSDDGSSTKSYKRATTHADTSGAVAVCKPVAGSVSGADFGCYSVRTNASLYAVGLTAAEIRSSNGLPSDDVRWRGRDSNGSGTTASNRLPGRMRFRGITIDSTGEATQNAGNAAFDSGGSGIPTSPQTEASAVYNDYVDSRRWSTNSVSSAFWAHYESGLVWDTRVDVKNPNNGGEVCQFHNSLAGLVSSIGSYYHVDTDIGGATVTSWLTAAMPPCLLGAKLLNIRLAAGGNPDLTAQPKLPVYGAVLHNVEIHATMSGNPGSPALDVAVPMTALGVNNMLIRMDTTSTAMANAVGVTYDDTYTEIFGANVYGLAVALPNISFTSDTNNDSAGRINWFYQDQLEIRLNKDGVDFGCVARQFNTKGDVFSAPAPSPSASTIQMAWTANTPYWKGAIVSDIVPVTTSSTFYQVLADIPANSGFALSNTAHYRHLTEAVSSPGSAAPTGPQPLRQGNGDFRDGVDCGSNVYAATASTDTPSVTSWFGRNRGFGSKAGTPVLSNFWNNPGAGDFTPKPGGELVNMVPAGKAWSPIDLNGVTMLNDGTDAAGPLQIPH